MEMRKLILCSMLFILGWHNPARSNMVIGVCHIEAGSTFTLANSIAHIGNLRGSGLIKGENFDLYVDEFNFSGCIEYTGNCFIRCKNPIDYSRFIKKGHGTLSIVIRPFDFKKFDSERLSLQAESQIIQEALSLTDKQIEDRVKQIRYYAQVNSIDEKVVFNKVLSQLDEKIDYAKKHKNDKYDMDALKELCINGSFFAAGSASAFLFLKYSNSFQGNVLHIEPSSMWLCALIAAAASGVSLIGVPSTISRIFNPPFKSQLLLLEAVKNKVLQALNTPFVLEKEQVITL